MTVSILRWRATLAFCEPRRDPPVSAEELANQIRAVALLATMQQHNVVWQSATAVKEFAYGFQSLEVGKVAMAAHDSALQERRAGAVSLHLRVVVGF